MVLITAAVFAIMTLAVAEPVAVGGYPPVELREAPTATVVVQSGDHFWKISKETLGGRLEREPRIEEVHTFWLATIEINLDSIRSGDPDLIYPGEELMLPSAGD